MRSFILILSLREGVSFPLGAGERPNQILETYNWLASCYISDQTKDQETWWTNYGWATLTFKHWGQASRSRFVTRLVHLSVKNREMLTNFRHRGLGNEGSNLLIVYGTGSLHSTKYLSLTKYRKLIQKYMEHIEVSPSVIYQLSVKGNVDDSNILSRQVWMLYGTYSNNCSLFIQLNRV